MKIEKWNPSVKAATILLSVLLLSFQYLVSLQLAIFFACIFLLLFFSEASFKNFVKLLIPAFVAALGLFVMGLYYARGGSLLEGDLNKISSIPFTVRAAMSQNLYTAIQLSSRLLSYAGMGILFALTTKGEDFVKSLMHQCKMPQKFAYGILAAFHLMPGMVKEYDNVRLAYRVRNIRAGFCSRRVLFTMLVNSIHWSEAVAMAMESKGFCENKDRTYYTVPKVYWYDWVISFAFLFTIIMGMVFLNY